jgi:hypothetical protein
MLLLFYEYIEITNENLYYFKKKSAIHDLPSENSLFFLLISAHTRELEEE